MKKRAIPALLLALILLLSACGGGGGSSATGGQEPAASTAEEPASAAPAESTAPAASGELMPMRYYMPGAPTTEAEKANTMINEALAADGVPIDFQPMYVPWDQWVNKTNIMLSTGEEFELLHIMEDYVPTSVYAGRDALTPIDGLLDEYAPKMKGRFEQVLWDCATVNGKIYSVPAYWRDNSGDGEGKLNLRKDKLDEFGIAMPTTLENTISSLTELQAKWAEEDGQKRYVFEHSLERAPVALHRTYDSWPFYASQDGIFKVTQEGEASLYFGSEEFRSDCNFFHELYTKGLIHPDILNLPADTIRQFKDDGDFLMGVMTGTTETNLRVEKGITTAEIPPFYYYNPEKSYLCNLPLLNTNGIPSTAKNPQAGLLFLEWMYSSKENQDKVLYGIEGEHWTAEGDDEYSTFKDDANKPLYRFDAWMIEYVPYHRFDVEDVSTELERQDFLTNIYPDNTVYSPMVGFNFNSEPVKVEYANMLAEYTASILPIKVGVLSYAENFDAAMAKMEAAGCNAVIEEYQRQLTEYIASK